MDDGGVSYTEREYDYAVAKDLDILVFVRGDIARLPAEKIESDSGLLERLSSFKGRVSEKRVVSFWFDREQLRSQIIISLAKAIGASPAEGWVRGSVAANEDVLAQINRLREEMASVKDENARLRGQLIPKIPNIVSLNQVFIVEYSYVYYGHRDSHGSTSRDKIEWTWMDIFRRIAPSFYSPNTKDMIDSVLKGRIREETGRNSIQIPDSYIDTIKIQMSAYGFMSIYSAQTVRGGIVRIYTIDGIWEKSIAGSGRSAIF